MIDVAYLRIGVKAVEENGEDGSLTGGGGCENALKPKVMCGLADLLASRGVIGPQCRVA
jgi:hypothetical protein